MKKLFFLSEKLFRFLLSKLKNTPFQTKFESKFQINLDIKNIFCVQKEKTDSDFPFKSQKNELKFLPFKKK